MSYADPNDWFDPEDDPQKALEALVVNVVIAVIMLFCFGKMTGLI